MPTPFRAAVNRARATTPGRRRPAAATALLGCVAVGSALIGFTPGAQAAPRTTGPVTSTARAATPSPAVTTTAAAAANATTRAPRGTVLVSRADVDGDGRRDSTTITPARANGAAAYQVRTVTARGATATLVIGTPWLFGASPWFGAAGLDGVRGSELVFTTGSGAHTRFFRVLTWRGGKLLTAADPSTGQRTWYTDGALSTVKGYRFARSRGALTLTATTYQRHDLRTASAPMTGTISRFTWRRGAWQHTRTIITRAAGNSQAVSNAYGWHASGLPVD